MRGWINGPHRASIEMSSSVCKTTRQLSIRGPKQRLIIRRIRGTNDGVEERRLQGQSTASGRGRRQNWRVLKGGLESPRQIDNQSSLDVLISRWKSFDTIQETLLQRYVSWTVSYFDTGMIYLNILTIVVLISNQSWRESQLISTRWSVTQYTNDDPQYELVTDQPLHENLGDDALPNRGCPTGQ